ncbi:MAG: hypothetical protein WA823_02695 [Candidatus Acidiferrales bacterium]
MAERRILVGVLPETMMIDAGDQVEWVSNAGNLKVEFDSQRSPFGSNVFQAPPNVRIISGPTRPGIHPGSYKYKLSLNDVIVAQCEVIIREK